MRAFGYEQRKLFFGREQQSYALYRLTYFGFIAVIGASGSGKSSLVRAGLFPLLLDAQELRPWRIATMMPGGAPFERLADALATLGPDEGDDARNVRRERIEYLLRRSSSGIADALDEMLELAENSILIVVDQFEELFRNTTAESRDEIAAFVQVLLQLHRRRPTAHVLITMRSDFIGDCAQFTGLPEAVAETQYLVPSLSREQRRAAISKPLAATGGAIEPTLVERLLNDVGFENDQLPVLQHALARMWIVAHRRSVATLTLTERDYRDVGSLAGAISQHADEITRELEGRQRVVEAVFRALSERDADGRAVRRILTLGELVAESGMAEGDVRAVVDRFRARDCGFLLPAGGGLTLYSRIDVVHEALLRRWHSITSSDPAEVGWLEREDDDGRYYRSLLARLDGGETTLQLDRVSERFAWWTSAPHTDAWAKRYGGRRDLVERFFAQSLSALAEFEAATARAGAEEIERRTQRERATRRFLVVSGSIAAIAIVLLVVTFFALLGAERTSNGSLIVQSNFLTRDAEGLADRGDAVDAALLALQGLPSHLSRPDRPFTWPAYGALTDALANIRELHDYRLGGHDLRVRDAPDSRRFVAWNAEGKIVLWTFGAPRPDRIFHIETPQDVAVSADGRYIASGSFNGTVRLWDVSSGKTLHVFRERAPVIRLAFRNDARWLLVSAAVEIAGSSYNSSVYEVQTGRRIRSIAAIMSYPWNGPTVYGKHVMLFTSDLLFTSEKHVTVWDSNLKKHLRVFPETSSRVVDAQISEDGRLSAITHSDDSTDVWDNEAGRVRSRLVGHGSSFKSLRFSSDGHTVVVVSQDFARVWDSTTGKLISNITLREGDSAYVYAISNAGDKFATINGDGSIAVWSMRTGARLLNLAGHESAVADVAFNRDGSRLLSTSNDGTIREWNLAVGTSQILSDTITTGQIASGDDDVTVSRDGMYVAIAGRSLTCIYDSTNGTIVRTLHNVTSYPYTANTVTFSPDGRELLTGNTKFSGAVIWNWRAGTIERIVRAEERMNFPQLSPNGNRVLSTMEGTVRIRALSDGRVLLVRRTTDSRDYLTALHFSNDGRRVLAANVDGKIQVFDSLSGKTLLVLQAHNALLNDANFSPDGSRIATASGDQTARVWDAFTGALVAVRTSVGPSNSVAFSADGKRLLVGASDGAYLWEIATGRTMYVFRGFKGSILKARFARHDTRIVTLGSDNTARLWPVPTLPVCQQAIDAALQSVPHQLSSELASKEFITARRSPSILSALLPRETCR
jgi:WD40 repeat protein